MREPYQMFNLVAQINDEDAREKAEVAVTEWVKHANTREARSRNCVACGQVYRGKVNRVCMECMEKIVTSLIEEFSVSAKDGGDYARIQKAAYRQSIPFLRMSSYTKPDPAMFSSTRLRDQAGSRDVFSQVIFDVWVENASYHEGFERGQSLLAGLASGNLNHADFEVKVLEEDRDNNRKIDELRKKNAAAPS